MLIAFPLIVLEVARWPRRWQLLGAAVSSAGRAYSHCRPRATSWLGSGWRWAERTRDWVDDEFEAPSSRDFPRADFTVVRALLTRGRSYEKAVKAFEPYREIKEPNEGARRGMVEIARQARRGRFRPGFSSITGWRVSAPATIEAVVESLDFIST